MPELINEGDHVMLMKSYDFGNMKIVPAVNNAVAHFGKLHFDPSPLIGAEYGSAFLINGGTMNLIEDFKIFDEELSTTVAGKLTTFTEKSQFSQEKLVAKKKKINHANVVAVLRPTLMLLHQMLYARDKLGGIRNDILSHIVTSANLQNGSKCLVLDHTYGIITCAVLSRCLPDGKCIQLAADLETICNSRKTLAMLNIKSDDVIGKLYGITILDFYKAKKGCDHFAFENLVLRAKYEDHLTRITDFSTVQTERNLETGEKTIKQPSEAEKKDLVRNLEKRNENRERRNEERLRAAEIIKTKTVDSIILIAQEQHPLPMLKLTYDSLSPSRQFVIYCDCLDPLLECYQYLKGNCIAVKLNLSSPWFRRYQVLPDRTRPEMNSSGTVGYLLTGTKAIYGKAVKPVEASSSIEATTSAISGADPSATTSLTRCESPTTTTTSATTSA